MKLKYFALKNAELDWFNKPFLAYDVKEAKALVRNAVFTDQSNVLRRSLECGELFEVGEFDTDRGCFSGKPKLVCKVADIPLCGTENSSEGGRGNA